MDLAVRPAEPAIIIEERKLWDMRPEETVRAYEAFCVYADLPPRERSILRAWCKFNGLEYSSEYLNRCKRWGEFSRDYWWVERARAKDVWRQEQKDLARKEEMALVLESEYANMHVRVRELNEVAKKLREQIDDDTKLWVTEIKQIGYGSSAELVETKRFNSHLIEQFRSCLGDIAAELGERVKKTDVTSAGEAIKAYIGLDVEAV